jgi:hypothetical protein
VGKEKLFKRKVREEFFMLVINIQIVKQLFGENQLEKNVQSVPLFWLKGRMGGLFVVKRGVDLKNKISISNKNKDINLLMFFKQKKEVGYVRYSIFVHHLAPRSKLS